LYAQIIANKALVSVMYRLPLNIEQECCSHVLVNISRNLINASVSAL